MRRHVENVEGFDWSTVVLSSPGQKPAIGRGSRLACPTGANASRVSIFRTVHPRNEHRACNIGISSKTRRVQRIHFDYNDHDEPRVRFNTRQQVMAVVEG